jgi:hypothetical protein
MSQPPPHSVYMHNSIPALRDKSSYRSQPSMPLHSPKIPEGEIRRDIRESGADFDRNDFPPTLHLIEKSGIENPGLQWPLTSIASRKCWKSVLCSDWICPCLPSPIPNPRPKRALYVVATELIYLSS